MWSACGQHTLCRRCHILVWRVVSLPTSGAATASLKGLMTRFGRPRRRRFLARLHRKWSRGGLIVFTRNPDVHRADDCVSRRGSAPASKTLLMILPLAVIAYVNSIVIPLEESKLQEAFGDQYDQYRARWSVGVANLSFGVCLAGTGGVRFSVPPCERWFVDGPSRCRSARS